MLRISRHNFYLPSWKRAERDIISGIREGRIFVKAFILNLSYVVQFSSVAQLCLTLRVHGHCPSSTPRAYSNSCPLHRWCHPTISSSIVPLSSCLRSFQTSGSFQMSQFFSSGGQRIGASASASILPMNIHDWFPLGLTGCISLLSKWLSSVFSNITVQKHQFFSAKRSL